MAGAAELLTSDRKQLNQSESTENVETKRRRILDRSKLMLTDLNDDCLIAIFDYLDMDDLMNITEASARLTLAAGLVVLRQEVVVTNVYKPNPEKVPYAVKLLKRFGSYISKLIIEYKSEFRHFDKLIEDAIIEHCRNSLLEITFKNADWFTMHEITECFPNVLKVKFMEGQWCSMIAEFNKWFPKAQSLDLIFEGLQCPEHSAQDDILNTLRQNFPSLQHLGLITDVSNENFQEDQEYLYFSTYDVVDIIRQNPQLKSLKIENIRRDVWILINKLLPELTNLEFTAGWEGEDWQGDENWENGNAGANRLLFKNLKCLKISLQYSSSSALADVSISTTRLEKLELEHNFEVKSDCLKFIYNNRNMHTLRLKFQCDLEETAVDLLALLPKLPNLRKLEMDYQHGLLKIIQLTKMLNSCKSLVKMTINKCNAEEREAFQQSTLSTGVIVGTDFKTALRHELGTVVLHRAPKFKNCKFF